MENPRRRPGALNGTRFNSQTPMACPKFLMPKASAAELRGMALMAIAAALIAGFFGVLHDQVTFSISPEYFTRMKFEQFRKADLGFPPRIFVAQIGFLATWWVGLIAGWFLARIAVPKYPIGKAWRIVMKSILWIVVGTILSGVIGCVLGPLTFPRLQDWRSSLESMGVVGSTAFERVAGIHMGGYIGALVSWLCVMAAMRWRGKPI